MDRHGTACITGASSGIGEVFARRLAGQGYNLLLHGRRKERLEQLCFELQQRNGIRAEFILADFSRPEEIRSVEDRIRGVQDLELLVNNAGFGARKSFTRGAIEPQEEMINTHVFATVRLTHAALRGMLERNRGTIINVSSVAGFLVGPNSATYCATKSYITSFTESLHLELNGTGIRIQALCPGFTRSDFHARIGFDTSGDFFRNFMSAEEVVDASLRSLKGSKVICVPGIRYKLVVIASRLLPRRVYYWIAQASRGSRLRSAE